MTICVVLNYLITELDEEEDDTTVSPDELHKVSRRKKRKVAAAKVW